MSILKKSSQTHTGRDKEDKDREAERKACHITFQSRNYPRDGSLTITEGMASYHLETRQLP